MSISILNRGASGGLTASIFVTGLSETDTVSASKDGKTINGVWIPPEESGRYTEEHPECIVSDANYLLYTYGTRNYKKAYAGDAYACTVVVGGWLSSLLVSRNQDAVAIYTDGDYSSGVLTGGGVTVTFRGEAWYISSNGAAFEATTPTTSNVMHFGTFSTREEAALAFLEYVALKPVGLHEITGIKDLGLWTVTASNGEETATQDVLVDVIAQFEIEMSYRLWLYNEGDECEDVTGGWVKNSMDYGYDGYVTKNENAMYIHGGSGSSIAECGAITNNQIDLSGYTTLNVEVIQYSDGRYSTYTFQSVIVLSKYKVDRMDPNSYPGWKLGGVTGDGIRTYQIDVSSTASAYVWLLAGAANADFTVTKVWLE